MPKVLPAGFLDYITQYPQLSPLAQSLLTEPDVSVRLNPDKLSAQEMEDFQFPDIECDQVPWCEEGLYLSQRPKFTFDPRIHQGLFYVQDASSMAISAAIRHLTHGTDKPISYLDCCAAPGGKTTCALAALPKGSLVVANEYDFKRAEILAENIAKWGNPNAVVTRGDTRALTKLGPIFDIVAVDAPCSGEGMMRKDEDAINQWSTRLQQSCSTLQKEILENAWTCLKPGGFLIYSTCTFNRYENEENLQWIITELQGEPIPIPALSEEDGIAHGIDTALPCYRFIPGKTKGEGLFMAVVRKSSDSNPRSEACNRKKAGKGGEKDSAELSKVLKWLKQDQEWKLKRVEDEIFVMPALHSSVIETISSKTDAIMPGLHIATIKGKDIIPTQELALSTALASHAFPSRNLDEATAISFLQRQNIELQNAPKGYVLLIYNGKPLGFVKNLGNRSNNLYPKNWRIRTQF